MATETKAHKVMGISPFFRSLSWAGFPGFPPGYSCSWNTASCLGRCTCTQAWNKWRLQSKGGRGGKRFSLKKSSGSTQNTKSAGRCRIHLWTRGSRPRGNVCRGRCGSEAHLWGLSAASLSTLSAQCCTTQSALAGSWFSLGGRRREKRPI